MEEIYPCATKSGSDEQCHHQHTTSSTPEVSFTFNLWDNLNLKPLGNLGRRDGTVAPNIRANLITNIFIQLNVCLVHVINLVLGLSLQTWEQCMCGRSSPWVVYQLIVIHIKNAALAPTELGGCRNRLFRYPRTRLVRQLFKILISWW